jgi:hypothetical protein
MNKMRIPLPKQTEIVFKDKKKYDRKMNKRYRKLDKEDI